MNKEFAQKFALDWVAAWNSRDLDRVLAHYAEAYLRKFFILTATVPSPKPVRITNNGGFFISC